MRNASEAKSGDSPNGAPGGGLRRARACRRRAPKQQQNIIGFLASLAAGVAGVWLAPFSPLFVLAAVACGVVYVVLRFAFWTPKSDWLPFLVAMLVVMAGRVVTRSWILPGIRQGSAADTTLSLLFIGIVGVVVFGYRLLYSITKARGSL